MADGGVYGYTHAIVKERIIFCKVDHIESILSPANHLLNGEVKPLVIARRINIVLHDEIILSIGNFEGCEEVAGLKIGIKNKIFLIGEG